MQIKKILIYGSSPLTAEACKLLNDHYDLVGYIPSIDPVIAGDMILPIVDDTIEHDIKLSLQYNRRMDNIENAFNVHTGLLPSWGGQDILYHTLRMNAQEQGLTFHKMTPYFDYGEIISKSSYMVYKDDTMIDLYTRMVQLFPSFVLGSLKILESVSQKQIKASPKTQPVLYKRGQINPRDLQEYKNTLLELRKKYENNKI